MLKGKIVLVVEDNATVRRFIVSVLKNQLNCENVLQAASADEALKMLAAYKSRKMNLTIILSDWEMPGMSGDNFLLTIREDPDTRDVPFVMVTARNDRDSIVMAAQAGVSEYLIKPFSATTLIQKVHRALGMQERRAMARFKSNAGDAVELRFNASSVYSSSLVNISQTGLLVRAPIFKHGPVSVYDVIDITIKHGEQTVCVKGELVRLEADKDPALRNNFLLAAFQFHEVTDEAGDVIRGIVGQFALLGQHLADEVIHEPGQLPAAQSAAEPAPEPKKKRLDMDM